MHLCNACVQLPISEFFNYPIVRARDTFWEGSGEIVEHRDALEEACVAYADANTNTSSWNDLVVCGVAPA